MLFRSGGHNILEAAFFNLPVIVGPHMENFSDIAQEYSEARAWVEISDAVELTAAVEALLKDEKCRAELGERARRLAESKRGAARGAVEEIRLQYPHAVGCLRRSLPAYFLLWPLSLLWRLFGRWKQRFDLARRASLKTPVISVGSLAMGGTGKTALVLWLARRLKEADHEPAILTRGYGRRLAEKHTILEAGARVPPARTGDEPQIFLRAGIAPVGIGAERVATGRLLEQRFHPGVFLLDDGFQHWRLGRTLDIVVIDALDPFAGAELFPLGRLREPLESLERAGVIVIARAERELALDGIEAEIRRHNSRAPVFRSRVVAEFFEDAASGQRWAPGELPFSSVAAFCGLGNPASFRRSLAALGARPVFCRAFRDHHRYKRGELGRLALDAKAGGAEALLTTEKDLMNLAEGWRELIAPLRLCWLKIGVEIEHQEEFLEVVESRLKEGHRVRFSL